MKRHAKSRIRYRKPIHRSPATNPKAQDNVDIKKDRFNLIAKALDDQQMAIRRMAANPSLMININKQLSQTLDNFDSIRDRLPDLGAFHAFQMGSIDERAKQAADHIIDTMKSLELIG